MIAIRLGPAASTANAAHPAHPRHDPVNECTCVGPCQGAGATGVVEADQREIRPALGDELEVAPTESRPVHARSTSYLFPLPNAPPTHA